MKMTFTPQEAVQIWLDRKAIMERQIEQAETGCWKNDPFFGGEKNIQHWKGIIAECDREIARINL